MLPCSGEGMFRKDPKALKGWQVFNGQVCREMQDRILRAAAELLLPAAGCCIPPAPLILWKMKRQSLPFLAEHPDFFPFGAPCVSRLAAGSSP